MHPLICGPMGGGWHPTSMPWDPILETLIY